MRKGRGKFYINDKSRAQFNISYRVATDGTFPFVHGEEVEVEVVGEHVEIRKVYSVEASRDSDG